jgi:hypothetical protein
MNMEELLRSIYRKRIVVWDWNNLKGGGRKRVVIISRWGAEEKPTTVNTESSAGDLTVQRKNK